MTDQAKVIALRFGRLQEVVHTRRELAAKIPAGTALETILDPLYWKHYTRDLRPLDIIEAFCEDGSWEASLRVMFVARGEARVAIRWKVEYDETEVSDDAAAPYAVKWLNVGKKYAVIRSSDKEIIEDGLFPKEEAEAAMVRHTKNMNT